LSSDPLRTSRRAAPVAVTKGGGVDATRRRQGWPAGRASGTR